MLRIREELSNAQKKNILDRLIADIKAKGYDEQCFISVDRRTDEISDYSFVSGGGLCLQMTLTEALYAFVSGFKRQKYGVQIGRNGNILTVIRLLSGLNADDFAKKAGIGKEELSDYEKGVKRLDEVTKNALITKFSFPKSFHPEVEFD